MLVLSENIKRILNRIEETIQDDIKKGVQYPVAYKVDGTIYPDEKATYKYWMAFHEFKDSLEKGYNPILRCCDDQKEEAMLEVVSNILKFYEPFNTIKIYNIENEAIIDEELIQRLKNFRARSPKDEVAKALENFFNNPCASSWTQWDACCGLRIFKPVSTYKEYEEILKKEYVRDITSVKPKKRLNIRIAFSQSEAVKIIEEKGLKYDFERFMYKYAGQGNISYKIKEYEIWHGIRRTGIYYIYIPNRTKPKKRELN